jgi:predicted metal-dependent RNase
VSHNENNYCLYQYLKDGPFNVTRPINSELMISAHDFEKIKNEFNYSLLHIKEVINDQITHKNLNRFIYTC